MDTRILAVFLAFTACSHARDIPIKPVAATEAKIADKAKVMPPPPPPETKAIAPVMSDVEIEDPTSRSETQ